MRKPASEKSLFATGQLGVEEFKIGRTGLFQCEEILEKKCYLTGSQLTEADIRLFTTLVRFDPVYVGHFKVNIF